MRSNTEVMEKVTKLNQHSDVAAFANNTELHSKFSKYMTLCDLTNSIRNQAIFMRCSRKAESKSKESMIWIAARDPHKGINKQKRLLLCIISRDIGNHCQKSDR